MNIKYESNYLALNPVHEKGDVLIGRQWRGLLVLGSVLPEVFELRTAGHRRTRRVGALLADGSVNQVDPIEEVDNVNWFDSINVEMLKMVHFYYMQKTIAKVTFFMKK